MPGRPVDDRAVWCWRAVVRMPSDEGLGVKDAAFSPDTLNPTAASPEWHAPSRFVDVDDRRRLQGLPAGSGLSFLLNISQT